MKTHGQSGPWPFPLLVCMLPCTTFHHAQLNPLANGPYLAPHPVPRGVHKSVTWDSTMKPGPILSFA